MKTLEQLHALASASLAAGEEPVAAVRVNYNGTVQPNVIATNPAVGGVADAEAGGPDLDTLVAFPAAKQMALLLTGGRLLAWSLGFSGKPKHFIGEVPLSAIREVHAGEIRFGPLVRVVMRSGATVDLEILRNEDADGFIDHLQHLVGGGSHLRPAGVVDAALDPVPGEGAGAGASDEPTSSADDAAAPPDDPGGVADDG